MTSVSKNINASANEVWETISKLNDVEKYLEVFVCSSVEGDGVGAKRICNFFDGRIIEEEILTLDDEQMILEYGMLKSDLPLNYYKAKIKVIELEDGTSKVEWSSEFETDDSPEQEMKELIETAHIAGINNLEKLHHK